MSEVEERAIEDRTTPETPLAQEQPAVVAHEQPAVAAQEQLPTVPQEQLAGPAEKLPATDLAGPPPPDLAGPTPAAPQGRKPREGMGRRRILDTLTKERICMVVRGGSTLADAADYVMCTRKTIYNQLRRDPEFRNEIRKAKAERHVLPLTQMRLQAMQSWRANAWYLEKVAPERILRKPGMTSNQELELILQSWTKMYCELLDNPEQREALAKKSEDLFKEALARKR